MLKKYKKFSFCLALVLCLGLTSVAAAGNDPAWAAPALKRWEDCGKLDAGVDTGAAITRGQAGALIDRVMGHEKPAQLTDPDRLATRQEMAVLTAQALGLTGQGSPEYRDGEQIAPWAKEAVALLQQKGVMRGFDGAFRPTEPITYAEAVQTLTNALSAIGPVTNLSVRTRSADGVLAAGEPVHVNDGRFAVSGVEQTGEGYRVTVTGLKALAGQKADVDGTGRPEKAGKWMGLQFEFHGLVRVDELQYSKDGESWKAAELNEAFAADMRTNSLMVFLGGTEEESDTAAEVEKDTKLQVRVGDEGQPITIEIHYTPA